jgi:histidine triad (HIT) family protein
VTEAACLFCSIAAGGAAAAVVADEPDAVAFLDRAPLFPGHVLVIPRLHVETIADAGPDVLGSLFGLVRRVAIAVEAGLDAHGSHLAVNNRVSQSVAHLHVHVVPRRRKDGLRGFFWPRQRYADDAEMADVAARIRSALPARG